MDDAALKILIGDDARPGDVVAAELNAQTVVVRVQTFVRYSSIAAVIGLDKAGEIHDLIASLRTAGITLPGVGALPGGSFSILHMMLSPQAEALDISRDDSRAYTDILIGMLRASKPEKFDGTEAAAIKGLGEREIHVWEQPQFDGRPFDFGDIDRARGI